jgi:predicted HTH domain antitoxin
MKLHELGHLSSGAAAELAGISKVAFLHKLADFGVDAFRMTPEELARDLDTLRRSLG